MSSGESGSERVPPLNMTAGERDVLLDLVTTADDMGYDDEDLDSLIEKTKALYRYRDTGSERSSNASNSEVDHAE